MRPSGSDRFTPPVKGLLVDGRVEARLAQVGFRPGAPDHDLGYVLDVAGKDNLLLVLVADESFLLQLVERDTLEPSESTTCQYRSGVSGTTKSSDSVRTL